MKYSIGFKESIIKKTLAPGSQSISSIAKEAGISEQALRNWINKAKDGTLKQSGAGSPNRSAREKLSLVIESRNISEEDLGKWLREHGLHTEHLNQYEQELRDMVENKHHDEKQTIKKLKKENRHLQKELDKKEKALAEMAALYTLKKKAEALWGDSGED